MFISVPETKFSEEIKSQLIYIKWPNYTLSVSFSLQCCLRWLHGSGSRGLQHLCCGILPRERGVYRWVRDSLPPMICTTVHRAAILHLFVSSVCEDGKFGVNCTGTCHCLNGAADCRKSDGLCRSFTCEWGWSGVPYCQTRKSGPPQYYSFTLVCCIVIPD